MTRQLIEERANACSLRILKNSNRWTDHFDQTPALHATLSAKTVWQLTCYAELRTARADYDLVQRTSTAIVWLVVACWLSRRNRPSACDNNQDMVGSSCDRVTFVNSHGPSGVRYDRVAARGLLFQWELRQSPHWKRKEERNVKDHRYAYLSQGAANPQPAISRAPRVRIPLLPGW